MRRRLVGAVTALLIVQLVAVGSADARSRDRRRGDNDRYERRGRVELRGSSRSFHMREFRGYNSDHDRTRVRVDHRSSFGFEHRRRGDFDRDDYRQRFVRSDDHVGVRRHVVTHHVVRHHDVDVVHHRRDRRRFVSHYPVHAAPYPVYVAPRPVVYVPAPVFVHPHPAYVTGPQLILRGRAPIGSRIMVEVTAVFGQSVLYPVTYDSYADHHGGFAVPIHAAHPGHQHRIKVWSVMNGVYSEPAGLMIYRR